MSMPTVFVSHGSPTLILEDLPARAFLASLGQLLPRPKAIVAVSAHWNTERPAVSTARRPETIHDFYGFPERSTACTTTRRARRSWRSGWPSSPARRTIRSTGSTTAPGCRRCWAGPRPTSRSSSSRCSPTRRPAHHIALGRKLAPLREEGMLVMGSGSATHNLRRLVRGQHDCAARAVGQGVRRLAGGDAWRRATRRRWRLSHRRRRMPATPIRPTSISCRCMSPSARPARARTDARCTAASPPATCRWPPIRSRRRTPSADLSRAQTALRLA